MAYSVENFLSVISCGSDNLWIYKNSTIVNDFIIDDLTITVDTTFFLNKIICSVWMRKGDPRKLSDLAIIKNKRYVRQGLKNEFVIFEEKIPITSNESVLKFDMTKNSWVWREMNDISISCSIGPSGSLINTQNSEVVVNLSNIVENQTTDNIQSKKVEINNNKKNKKRQQKKK